MPRMDKMKNSIETEIRQLLVIFVVGSRPKAMTAAVERPATEWISLTREQLPVIFANAQEDGLTNFVVFFDNREKELRYLSMEESASFGFKKSQTRENSLLFAPTARLSQLCPESFFIPAN